MKLTVSVQGILISGDFVEHEDFEESHVNQLSEFLEKGKFDMKEALILTNVVRKELEREGEKVADVAAIVGGVLIGMDK